MAADSPHPHPGLLAPPTPSNALDEWDWPDRKNTGRPLRARIPHLVLVPDVRDEDGGPATGGQPVAPRPPETRQAAVKVQVAVSPIAQASKMLLVLAAIGTLIFTGYQAMLGRRASDLSRKAFDANNQLVQAQLDAGLQRDMVTLDRSLAAQPELDPYFSDNRLPPSPHHVLLRARVLETGNEVLDFADEVASYMREGTMAPTTRPKWALIMRSYFNESPATRWAWREFAYMYPASTACVLGAPRSVRSWNWKTNEPSPKVQDAGACGDSDSARSAQRSIDRGSVP